MDIKTTLSSGKVVSTVRLTFPLGRDQRYETMVFPSMGNYSDEECHHTETAGAALRKHVEVVYRLERKDNAAEIEVMP